MLQITHPVHTQPDVSGAAARGLPPEAALPPPQAGGRTLLTYMDFQVNKLTQGYILCNTMVVVGRGGGAMLFGGKMIKGKGIKETILSQTEYFLLLLYRYLVQLKDRDVLLEYLLLLLYRYLVHLKDQGVLP